MSISISSTPKDDGILVAVSGEVDVSNASDLRDELNRVLEGPSASIEVELSQVSYIDSAGIGVLVGAAHRAGELSRTFNVLHPQPNVSRVLGLLGVSKELGVIE